MARCSRREFLEKSMFATATLSLANAPRAFAADGDTPAPADKFRVAVVGVKGRGGSHIAGFGERSDCEIAALVRIPRVRRSEVEETEPILPAKSMDTAIASVVPQGRSDRVVDRCGGVVFDCESEEGDRHRRVTVVVRDERTERRHAHLAWKIGLTELKFGQWKASDECDVAEVWNSGH